MNRVDAIPADDVPGTTIPQTLLREYFELQTRKWQLSDQLSKIRLELIEEYLENVPVQDGPYQLQIKTINQIRNTLEDLKQIFQNEDFEWLKSMLPRVDRTYVHVYRKANK